VLVVRGGRGRTGCTTKGGGTGVVVISSTIVVAVVAGSEALMDRDRSESCCEAISAFFLELLFCREREGRGESSISFIQHQKNYAVLLLKSSRKH
jgi:hypothetical protein